MTFEDALKRWHKAERKRIDLRVAYERTYAEAVIGADGRNAEARKAQADLTSLEALHAYENALIDARVFEQLVLHLRAQPANLNALPRGAQEPDAVGEDMRL